MISDRDRLLRSVLLCPEDDQQRLVMADFLEENGEAEYSEFIRLQIELTRHQERKQVGFEKYQSPVDGKTKRIGVLMIPHGPDYWSITCREFIQVGDRIDVNGYNRSGSNKRIEYGLLVTQERGEDYIVKRDAESRPSKYAALKNREADLWLTNGLIFSRLLPFTDSREMPNHVTAGTILNTGIGQAAHYMFNRGFVGTVRMRLDPFMVHAKTLFEEQPITKVELLGKKPISGGWIEAGRNEPLEHEIPRDLHCICEYLSLAGDHDAYSRLSRSCVIHGNNLAGLTQERKDIESARLLTSRPV